MRKPVEYALYKGDDFINIGTPEELAKFIGVKVRTIYFYATDIYIKRNENNPKRYIVFKLDNIDN